MPGNQAAKSNNTRNSNNLVHILHLGLKVPVLRGGTDLTHAKFQQDWLRERESTTTTTTNRGRLVCICSTLIGKGSPEAYQRDWKSLVDFSPNFTLFLDGKSNCLFTTCKIGEYFKIKAIMTDARNWTKGSVAYSLFFHWRNDFKFWHLRMLNLAFWIKCNKRQQHQEHLKRNAIFVHETPFLLTVSIHIPAWPIDKN